MGIPSKVERLLTQMNETAVARKWEVFNNLTEQVLDAIQDSSDGTLCDELVGRLEGLDPMVRGSLLWESCCREGKVAVTLAAKLFWAQMQVIGWDGCVQLYEFTPSNPAHAEIVECLATVLMIIDSWSEDNLMELLPLLSVGRSAETVAGLVFVAVWLSQPGHTLNEVMRSAISELECEENGAAFRLNASIVARMA